jgi:hypothetical protein
LFFIEQKGLHQPALIPSSSGPRQEREQQRHYDTQDNEKNVDGDRCQALTSLDDDGRSIAEQL